jgi:collagen triple helix repeat protein
MLSRSLVVMFIASVLIATVAGGLVGWGLSAATLASAHGAAGAQGDEGAPGATGAAGAAGAKGDAGATGATGATGAKGGTGAAGASGSSAAKGDPGAQGSVGPQGIQGIQGIPGTNGTNGTNGADGTNASIATYSFTSAGGSFPQFPFPFQVAAMTSAIPAGPALIGFSMSLSTASPFSPTTTCGLYDSSTATLLATASPVTLQPGISATTALTQVVTLATSTTLALECATPGALPDFTSYSNLSIYGLSFATN